MVLRYATEVIFCPCTATSRGWGKARKFEYSDFSITRVFCAYMYTQQKRRQPFNLSLQTILKNGRPISPRRDVYFRSRMTARVLRSAATKQRLSRRTERRWSFFLFCVQGERLQDGLLSRPIDGAPSPVRHARCSDLYQGR